MAVRKLAPAPEPSTEHEADLADVLAVVIRILCRLIVATTPGQYSATFTSIAVDQAKAATRAEVDVIERYLAEHPPGS
jgi:hypothetical protein